MSKKKATKKKATKKKATKKKATKKKATKKKATKKKATKKRQSPPDFAALVSAVDDVRREAVVQAASEWFAQGGDSDQFFHAFLAPNFVIEPRWPLGSWETALAAAGDWERAGPTRRVHKGSGYYWAAVRDIVRGNIERGFVYMHAALAEDRVNTQQSFPSTPAYLFVTLDSEGAEQFFKAQVDAYASYVEAKLERYRRSGRGALTLPEFRGRLLAQPTALSDALFVFVYTVARLWHLRSEDDIPVDVYGSDFGAVLFGGIALDLCVSVEHAAKRSTNGSVRLQALRKAWKEPARKPSTFIHVAGVLARISGTLTLSKADLRTIIGDFNSDFDQTVRALLNTTYRLGGRRTLTPREGDVAIAYGIRNAMAHSVRNEPVMAERSREIEDRLFFLFFTAIECLC